MRLVSGAAPSPYGNFAINIRAGQTTAAYRRASLLCWLRLGRLMLCWLRAGSPREKDIRRQPSPAVEIIQSSPGDRLALKQLADALVDYVTAQTGYLRGPRSEAIPFPESLGRALRLVAATLLNGDAVAISSVHRRLTTTEAGELLGISRQYLTRLIDRGEIPCDRTGRHRRIRLSDLLDYKRQRDEQRQRVLDELTADASALGAYD